MKSKLRELIDELLDEIQQEELDLEEATTTGSVAGYNTPNAFKSGDGTEEDAEPDDKFTKRINQSTGYKKVNESRWKELKKTKSVNESAISKPIQSLIDTMISNKIQRKTVNISDKSKHARFMKDVQPAIDSKLLIIKHNPIKNTEMLISLGPVSQKMIESITENRWQELKKDESSPQAKIGRGISNVNRQLSEIETFLGWYGKIKNEGDLHSDQHWKRTKTNLFRIKERLNNIATSISKL